MSTDDATLAALEGRFEQDGIALPAVQFVDIHGAAKVKLVPAGTFRDVVRDGRGVRGRGGLGHGAGAPLARHDGPRRPRDLYPAALRAGRRPVRGGPLR